MKKINFGRITLSSDKTKNDATTHVSMGFGVIQKETVVPQPSVEPKKAGHTVNSKKQSRNFDVDKMMAEFKDQMQKSKLNDDQPSEIEPKDNNTISTVMGFTSFQTSSKVKKPNPKAEKLLPNVQSINSSNIKINPPVEDKTVEEDEDELTDSDSEDDPLKTLPISHEITLDHSLRAVSGLALDPAGARLVSGSHDFDVKFWDFNAMDSRFGSFRTIQPMENYHIRSIEYSITGDCILIASGGPQAQVLNRDGSQVYECRKGDQYIVDMMRTKGHVSALYNAVWHKKDKNIFMTCSFDCTVRFWDVNDITGQKSVIKMKGRDGKKICPTHAIFNNDSSMIAVATADGAISLYPYKGPFIRPKMSNKQAHIPGSETSCLKFSSSGNKLLSRGGDNTMKLWDIRNMAAPVFTAVGLENAYVGTDCWFSPDEKLVMTGTSIKQGSGELVFLDVDTFKEVYRYSVGESSISKVLWHPKLNQIVVGCSNGKVKVYYSPELSFRGAKLCAAKPRRRQVRNEDLPTGLSEQVITPYSLPMFRENRHLFAKRRREKARKDPVKSSAPDKPAYGLDAHKTKGCSMSAYVSKQLALDNYGPPAEEEDPREVLLRFVYSTLFA